MNHSAHLLRIGSAGMRGIVGSGLDPERAMAYASAAGTIFDGAKVLVVRDNRASSEMLADGCMAALAGCGCEVIDGGLCSAGEAHYLVPFLNCAGALMITGGHQKAGWNAIVPLGADGAYFNDLALRELLDIYHSRRFRSVGYESVLPIVFLDDFWRDGYLAHLLDHVDVQAIQAAKFTILADFCNGPAAVSAKKLAQLLHCRLIPVNDEPSGRLAHDPEVSGMGATQWRSVMAPLHADAGFVFTSDANRCAMLTGTGSLLSDELTLSIGLDRLLARRAAKEAHVVTNMCSSRSVDDAILRHGGVIERTRVGQSAVIDCMKQFGADFAGEGSGSFTAAAYLPGFDGLFMMAVLLEAMAASGKTADALAGEFKKYTMLKSTVYSGTAHAYAVLRSVRGLFPGAKLSEYDGLRFDWPDGFVSVRLSGTDQLIRVISESESSQLAEQRELVVRIALEKQMEQ